MACIRQLPETLGCSGTTKSWEASRAIVVLMLKGDVIASLVPFVGSDLFARFGLPTLLAI